MIEDYQIESENETISKSHVFFSQAVRHAREEVARAESRLDDALASYDDEKWESANVIVRAEENLELCEAHFASNVLRERWEEDKQFSREIVGDRPMLTPWIHSPTLWLAIFVHYKMK